MTIAAAPMSTVRFAASRRNSFVRISGMETNARPNAIYINVHMPQAATIKAIEASRNGLVSRVVMLRRPTITPNTPSATKSQPDGVTNAAINAISKPM